jgi:hypothetical protein
MSLNGRRAREHSEPMNKFALVLPTVLITLAACENPARQSYWSIETIRGGTGTRIMTCANERVRKVLAGPKGGAAFNSQSMKATSVTTGNPKRDFMVTTEIDMTVGGETNHFEQTQHFRKAAEACPAGWTVGDMGLVGERAVMNALTGGTRELAAPIEDF